MAESLASLRQQLADHELTRPVMPRPYLPNSEEGIRFHKAYSLFVDRKNLLIHKIAVAEHPIELGVRQERPIVALPTRPPVRLRR